MLSPESQMHAPQEIVTYLLSPEARDLRPLLVRELVTGLDLAGRDRARRAADALPGLLAPRLPFFGALPALPTPPIYVPGLGLMSVADALRCGPGSWFRVIDSHSLKNLLRLTFSLSFEMSHNFSVDISLMHGLGI